MSDEPLPKAEELPADDDTLGHDLARLRQSLRARSDDRGRQLLGTADRVYTAQVRATKATLPEAQVLGLVQALTYSSEMHILTVQDCHDYLERLTAALEPAARLAATAERLETTLAAWQGHLTRVDEALARATGEIPGRIDHATTRAITEATRGYRRFLARALWMGWFLILLMGASLFFSWKAATEHPKAPGLQGGLSTKPPDQPPPGRTPPSR